MEIIALAALVLAAFLIKRFAYWSQTDVIDRADAAPARDKPGAASRAQPAQRTRRHPAPTAPIKQDRTRTAPRAATSKWRDSTPSPAGARHEMSPRGQRACALADRALREGGLKLKGRAWVIDGDTIVINKTHIRLAGIDAPELDQPYGRLSKSAMIQLCKGRDVIAEIKPEMSHDRVVAVCTLEDGTDLAEALVRKGLALDWYTYSKGRYRAYEPDDARKKLWKTAKRQGRAAV